MIMGGICRVITTDQLEHFEQKIIYTLYFKHFPNFGCVTKKDMQTTPPLRNDPIKKWLWMVRNVLNQTRVWINKFSDFNFSSYHRFSIRFFQTNDTKMAITPKIKIVEFWNLVLLSIQPIADILRKKNFEKKKKKFFFLGFEKKPMGGPCFFENQFFFFFFFFQFFLSYNFSMPKNNVAGNSGMPLSANLWG